MGAIQRKEEAIETSVSATLPILLDQRKEIMSIACCGDVKKMCALMITHNLSIKDLLFVDKKSGATIFQNICALGHLELLLFFESMLPRKDFIEYLFLSNNIDAKVIEIPVLKSQPLVVKYLFDMKEVQNQYKNNDPMIFRICYWLFGYNSNSVLTDYVLSALQISKEKIIKMLSYQCPKQPGYKQGANAYHLHTIIDCVILYGSFDHLQRLIGAIGELAFIVNVFHLDGWRGDAMYSAVRIKNIKIIEYILSIDEIKKKYMSDNNFLYRLVKILNQFIANKKAVQCVVEVLGITEAKLKELKAFLNVNI